MFTPYLIGSKESNLFFSNSQFSNLLAPAVYLLNERENKIIRDLTFHEKNANNVNFTSDLTFINCTFTYCTTILSGGAIGINFDISLTTQYCTFRKNEAHKSGGAISFEQSRLIKIENCLIADNKCLTSGALQIKECEKVNIKYSNFTLNKSKLNTGAISCNEISNSFDITFTTISANEANMGGALNILISHGNVEDCLFYYNRIHRNTASSIRCLKGVILKISRTTFSEEKSPSLLFTEGNEIEIIKCRFGYSKDDEIQKRVGNVTISDDTVFDSILPYQEVVLPPLKPLYDNEDDFVPINNEKKKDLFPKRLNNVTIKDELLSTDRIDGEVASNFSFTITVFIFLAISILFFFWFVFDKGTGKRLDRLPKNNFIFNDTDLRSNNKLGVSEFNDAKFQLNNDDLPDLKMEKI